MHGSDDSSGRDGRSPPSERIVQRIADLEGVDPIDLRPPEYDPLFTVVDPEALDRLFHAPDSGVGGSTGTVTFEYVGYAVSVDADGTVAVGSVDDVDETIAGSHSDD